MTTISPVQCLACGRLDRSTAVLGGTVVPNRCTAYPGGIPEEIALYGADHRAARGDEVNGRIFQQDNGPGTLDAFAWWRRTFDRVPSKP